MELRNPPAHPPGAQAPRDKIPQARGQAADGWAALLAGRNGVRSLALAGGVALHAVNVYIATTILPSVVESIGGLAYYAWNTALFVVASVLGSAWSVRLLARLGPRGAYVAASLVFALGALVCGAAPGMPVLLAGRFVQGLGGGLLLALCYAMIRLVFREALWPRAMGMVSGMWGVATLVGPAVGGMFAQAGAWRWAFWAVVPVSLLFALLARAVLPQRAAGGEAAAPLPRAQLVLLTLAVAAVSAGSVSAQPWVGIAGLLGGLALTAALFRAESRARGRVLENAHANTHADAHANAHSLARPRLLPAGALQLDGRLGALYAVMALLSLTVMSSEIFVPLFLQVLHRQEPLAAGYLAALMAAGWTTGSILGAGLAGPWPARAVRAAPALVLGAIVLLAWLMPAPTQGGAAALAPLCAALFTAGLGVGLGWPHLLTRIMQAVPPRERDMASASLTTVQLFAAALGSAAAGMVANLAGLAEPGGLEGTANAARWLFGVFALPPQAALLVAGRAGRD